MIEDWAFIFNNDDSTWPNISLRDRYLVVRGTWESAQAKMRAIGRPQWRAQMKVDKTFDDRAHASGWRPIRMETLEMNGGARH